MKKNLILIMAALTLITFGTASSSHAFVGLTTVTIVCVSAFVAIVAGDKVMDKSEEKQSAVNQEAKTENEKPALELSGLSPGS